MNPPLLLLVGCLFYDSTRSSPDAKKPEGAFSGECHNGEDDDGDGAVDCRDEDCADAENCAPHAVDSGSDSGSDSGLAVHAEEAPSPDPDPIEHFAVPASVAGAAGLLFLRRRQATRA